MPNATTGTVDILREINLGVPSQHIAAVFAQPFVNNVMDEGWRIMTNVRNEQTIGVIGMNEDILRAKVGCGLQKTGAKLTVSDRKMRIRKVTVGDDMCIEDFSDTIMAYALENGYKHDDLYKNRTIRRVFNEFLLQKFTNAMVRQIWAGNESSTNVSYNAFDGILTFIPQLVDAQVTPKVAAPTAFNPGDGLQLLKDMYAEQDKVLYHQDPNKKCFYLTRGAYEQYYEDIEGLGGGDAGRNQTINGWTGPMYRGIKIKQVSNMGIWLSEEHTDLGENFCLLAHEKNIVAGTDQSAMNATVESEYDTKDQKRWYRMEMEAGANYVLPELFVAAY